MPIFNTYPPIDGAGPNDLALFWDAETNKVKTVKAVPVKTLPTITSLRAQSVATLPDGFQVSVSKYAADDEDEGGGGVFEYDSTSVEADNLGTIIAPNSGAGRWIRVYSGAVNVKWFGAKGDGTTDDYAAIQAALDEFTDVFVPGGTFVIRTPLSISQLSTQFHGTGKFLTTIRNLGTAEGVRVESGSHGVTISNMLIDSNGGAHGVGATSTYGIHVISSSGFRLSDAFVATHGSHGVFLSGDLHTVVLEKCEIYNNFGSGFCAFNTPSGGVNAVSILNCAITDNNLNGIHAAITNFIISDRCTIESNLLNGILIDATGANQAFGVVITNNYFESNRTSQINLASDASRLLNGPIIEGNYFFSSYVGGGNSLVKANAGGCVLGCRIGLNSYNFTGGTVTLYLDAKDLGPDCIIEGFNADETRVAFPASVLQSGFSAARFVAQAKFVPASTSLGGDGGFSAFAVGEVKSPNISQDFTHAYFTHSFSGKNDFLQSISFWMESNSAGYTVAVILEKADLSTGGAFVAVAETSFSRPSSGSGLVNYNYNVRCDNKAIYRITLLFDADVTSTTAYIWWPFITYT